MRQIASCSGNDSRYRGRSRAGGSRSSIERGKHTLESIHELIPSLIGFDRCAHGKPGNRPRESNFQRFGIYRFWNRWTDRGQWKALASHTGHEESINTR